MKTILSILCICWMFASAKAQNSYFEIYTDSAALKNQNDEMIRDIEASIKLLEPSFSFKGLTTEIPKTFMPGQYRSKTNKIYQPTWQVGGPPMEKFLTDVSGSTGDAKVLAGMFFYGFFLPHEIGHAFQQHTGAVSENNYDGEYKANEFAVAYWRSKGKKKELDKCLQLAKTALANLKNPIPDGVDKEKYLTEHYNELLKDPYKYGYIQFSQIVNILENKLLPDFNTYVKEHFKK